MIETIDQTNNRLEAHIKSIYDMVSTVYPNLVLTGSSALFIYLKALGYQDLLFKLDDPNDVDILIPSKKKIAFNIHSTPFANFQPKQTTLESSITLINSTNNTSFDLSGAPINIKSNTVLGFRLIKIENLLDQYKEEVRPEKKKADENKIKIIDDMLLRLEVNPRLDIIVPNPQYQSQSQSHPFQRHDLGGITRSLFSEPALDEQSFGRPSFGEQSFGRSSFGEQSFGRPSLGNLSQLNQPYDLFSQSSPPRAPVGPNIFESPSNLAKFQRPPQSPPIQHNLSPLPKHPAFDLFKTP